MGISDLQGLASKFSVLYVEDEIDARESVEKTLKRVGFANLYVAENGQDGLAIFRDKRPQIVISDIQMPIMNGLDMVKEILEIADDTRVILTTAFGDQEYFMRSIDLKVDKYIIKPIDVMLLMEALTEVCKRIEQKRLANAYLAKEAQEKLNSAVSDAMKLMMDASPYPTTIFKNGRLSYINDSFLEVLSHKNLDSLDDGILPDIFERKNGYLGGLEEYKEGGVNKVCIKSPSGKDRIFEVTKKDSAIDNQTVSIFFLSDITLLEYQRRKLQLFGNAVQKELIGKRLEEQKKSQNIAAQKVAARKINAAEYAAEVDKAIFEQLDELAELEGEMSEDITQFVERKNTSHLRDFADRLEKYSHTMKLLYEFEELSFAIRNISELMYEKSADLEASKIEKIAMYCSAIADDLSGWRNGIFVSRAAIDIHYLDDSLFSSCLQLEFEFKGIKLEDDGGDLELF